VSDGPESGIARRLDALPEEKARGALLRCCGSRRWVEAMLALRPFEEDRALLEEAERVWWALPEGDWLEAFAAHPRIGQRELPDAWTRVEQGGTERADPGVLEALAEGNRRYEDRFGFGFLVCATGRSAVALLGALETRLEGTREEELETAAAEQARITRLRLARLAADPGHGTNEEEGRMGISTHVLDTTRGRPAAGVRVTLERAGPDGGWTPVATGITDDDGRLAALVAPGELDAGTFRARFETGEYFRRRGVEAFHPYVEVTFTVADPGSHHHVPLLAGPYAFTTYRGS